MENAPNHNTNPPQGETQSEASLGSLILLALLKWSLLETWDPYRNGSKRFTIFLEVLYKYKVLQGVLEASNLQNLGSVSSCLFVKPAKTAS